MPTGNSLGHARIRGPVSISVYFDVPSVYVYLRDREHFKVARSKRIGRGLVLDFDSDRRLIGVSMLEPAALNLVFKQVVSKYPGARALNYLKSKREIIEKAFAAAS